MRSRSSYPPSRPPLRVVLFAPDRATRDLLAFALRIDGHLLRNASDIVELYGWLRDDSSERAHTVIVAATEYDRELGHLLRQCQASGDFTLVFVAGGDASALSWPARLGPTHCIREPLGIEGLRRAVLEAAVPAIPRPAAAYSPSRPPMEDEDSSVD